MSNAGKVKCRQPLDIPCCGVAERIFG